MNPEELKSGVRVSGLVAGQIVKVIAIDRAGEMFNLVLKLKSLNEVRNPELTH